MLEKFFDLNGHNTDVKTEFFAGITTFMTMSYILMVNPTMLASTGMDPYAVFSATAISAALATLIMSLRANLPIALAPGMDLNVLFILVAGQMGYTWQFVLTALLIESILYIILSLTPFRNAVIRCFPPQIKNAICVGVGLFITFIGLRTAGIVVADPVGLIKLGDIASPSFLVTAIGVISIGFMLIHRFKCALLIGILISSFAAIPLGVTSYSSFDMPDLFVIPSLAPGFMQFEWNNVFSFDMFKVVVMFLFVDIFGTTGTFISLATRGKFFDKEGKIPKARSAYLADAIGTLLASILGTSPVTSYIESATGIEEGGRTGLTSFTVAMLFLVSLFIAPIFLFVPSQASSAALIMVGIYMIVPIREINFKDYLYAIPAFIAIVVMPASNSIADGIIFSLISFVVLAFLTNRKNHLSKLAIIIALLCMLKYIFIY